MTQIFLLVQADTHCIKCNWKRQKKRKKEESKSKLGSETILSRKSMSKLYSLST